MENEDQVPVEHRPALKLSDREAAQLEAALSREPEPEPCIADSYPDETPEWVHGMFWCPLHHGTPA